MVKQIISIAVLCAASGLTAAQDKSNVFDRMSDIDISMSVMQKEMEYANLIEQREQREYGSSGLPRIVEVFPFPDGAIGAKIIYADGQTKTVREKQSIGKNMVVSSISTGGVVVSKGKKQLPLEFAVNTPNAAPGAAGNAVPGLPSAPGVGNLPAFR